MTKVLYPAAIHFKGSGFYSTDYGRGNRRQVAKDGDGGEGGESGGQGGLEGLRRETLRVEGLRLFLAFGRAPASARSLVAADPTAGAERARARRGRWGATLPSTMATTVALSSPPMMNDCPSMSAIVPPRRHRRIPLDGVRRFTQASWRSWFADRSVASGATRSSPMKGIRRKVLKLVISSATAWTTACCRLPGDVVVRRVELVHPHPRVDQARRPFIVCSPVGSATPASRRTPPGSRKGT